MNIIGKPLRKVDAVSKCIGRTLFADDIFLPQMLYAKILRSSRPYARIGNIDISAAVGLEGVKAVVLGRELPITFGILPVSQDEHTLAIDVVRYVGEPLVALAAVDEETAEEAIRQIKVEYEDLPPVMSIAAGIQPTSFPIQPYAESGNIHKSVSFEFGATEAAFQKADLVLDDLFFYQGNTHLPMEQHAAVASCHPDGKLTVWSSTQTPHYVHRALSRVLEMQANRIQVIACPNGGGFGGKSDPFSHEIAIAKLAIKAGRPVKIALTREEVFYCHRGRHPVLMHSKLGVNRDGRFTGAGFQTILDGGAYGSYGVASTYYTGALQTTTYHFPAYKFEGARLFTNKPPCGPKRGHGTPQPRFALEIQIDKAAELLGMDPAALRLKNLVPANSLTVNWLTIRTIALERCLEKVVAASGWKEKFRQLPYGRGIGLACGCYLSGAGLPIYWNNMPQSGVQLKLDRSGLVTVFCGSTDIGQGSDTVLASIVGEVLGIDSSFIRVVTGDTDLTPVDLGSYSSRVTLMTGNAAIQAAERARAMLDEAVAEELKIPRDRVVAAEGRLFDSEDPSKAVDFAKAVQLAEARFGTLGTVGSYTPPKSAAKFKGGGVGPSPTYSFSAGVVELVVDPTTGIIKVEKTWIAHDIGRAINPASAIGQVEGSVYMGLGEALMEEQEFRMGVHRTPSMLDYKSPTSLDMCPVETILVEESDPIGPFGAKEVGQGPLLPIPPAVCNAVYDAVAVRIDEIPVTPEKILKALKAKKQGKEGRYGPTSFPTIEYRDPLSILPPWEGGDGRAVDQAEYTRRTR